MYEAASQKAPLRKNNCAIILPGGGQQGAFEAAILVRLLEEGLLRGVESIAGVSSGAIVGAYAATGDIHAASIFHRNIKNGLFRYTPARLRNGIVDLTSVEHELRIHTPLNLEAFFLIIMPWNPDYTHLFKEFVTHLAEHLFALGLHEPLKTEIITHRRKNRIIYEQLFRSGYLASAYGVNVLIIHPTRTLIGVTSMNHFQIEEGMKHAYHYTGLLIDAMMASATC